MRILFVTNYYPPSSYGWGYMQLCEEVADGLSDRGHDVAVLTSTDCLGEEIDRPYPVYRLLHLDPDWQCGQSTARQFFVGRRRREKEDIEHLRRLVAEFQPQIVFFWHYIGIPRTVLQTAEQMTDVGVAYYLAGYHPEMPDEYINYWSKQGVTSTGRFLKRPLAKMALDMLAREGKPVSLRYDNVACVSDYVRQRLISQGLISPNAVVIYNGVELAEFSPRQNDPTSSASDGLRCIITGHVKREKGAHTIIEALALMQSDENLGKISLTILGGGEPAYVSHLQETVRHNGLDGVVKFHDPVPREQVPGFLRQHNTLILATTYDEPLARAMQEGMAMGLLVIGTITGGSGELLMHERTGLVFEAGNPESLAEQFRRALNEPELVEQMAQAGQQEVMERFTIQRTIEQVESFLEPLAKD